MDINKYIASGILEQYVLGDLPAAQRAEVERYASQYPEVRKEIEAIEDSLEQYAQMKGVTPPPGSEAVILEKINARPGSVPPATPPLSKPARSFNWLSIAAMLVALGAIIWGFLQYQDNRLKNDELAKLESQLQELEADCTRQLEEKAQTDQLIAFLRDRNTTPVEMQGTDKAPQATAVIYWNDERQRSYLDVVNMPQVPAGKQYQLWAIVDGQPVDMGVFDVVSADNNLVEVPFIQNPQAFAVTLEQAGGSPAPTLEEMYVIGNTT